MRVISIFSLLFSASLIFTSCKKGSNENCSITPENDLVICEADDTASSVNGFVMILYANGVDKKSEGNFTNGTRTGFWKFYYPNGEIRREGNFTNGKADGYWNVFYENGNPLSEGSFDDCKRDGFWKYYYEGSNYAVHYEGNYNKDEKTNSWSTYKENGTLESTHDCE